MLDRATILARIDDFVIAEVDAHPKDITRRLAQRFRISRQAASGHLRRLIRKGLVSAQGKTLARRYRLALLADVKVTLKVSRRLEEHEVWRTRVLAVVRDLPANVLAICNYGFTEILNNAKDHSASPQVSILVQRTAASVHLVVFDRGVGIFKKIRDAARLEDERHAILELVKGKFTTDPEHHTGEGIFFASRMFDRFAIHSGALALLHSREKEDWLVEDGEGGEGGEVKGTTVEMTINTRSAHTDREVFDKYAIEQDDYAFRKTHVIVALSRSEGEGLVSRSQAKRLMARLDRFREVVLDFKGIDSIGPAFADEVFRVFQASHPDTGLTVLNDSEAVGRMIRRARNAAREPRGPKGTL